MAQPATPARRGHRFLYQQNRQGPATAAGRTGSERLSRRLVRTRTYEALFRSPAQQLRGVPDDAILHVEDTAKEGEPLGPAMSSISPIPRWSMAGPARSGCGRNSSKVRSPWVQRRKLPRPFRPRRSVPRATSRSWRPSARRHPCSPRHARRSSVTICRHARRRTRPARHTRLPRVRPARRIRSRPARRAQRIRSRLARRARRIRSRLVRHAQRIRSRPARRA